VQKPDALSGTWFVDFVLTAPDGKVSHDTAVLIFDRHGSVLTGSSGRTVDQQTPYCDGRLSGNRVSFHLDVVGGLDFVLTLKARKLTGIATGRNAKPRIWSFIKTTQEKPHRKNHTGKTTQEKPTTNRT
jgi:hypothetical protein